MANTSQPWLKNPLQETIFILAPALLPVAIVILFQDYFLSTEVSTLWWVVLVLCIDVSHVYSTLFRLYWDPITFTSYKKLLLTIPLISFILGFTLHYYDPLLFWRVLAYVAVYHFVRQQYGFMKLYSRQENGSRFNKIIDALTIYNATLFPLLYWHIKGTNKIAWFVPGDFVQLNLSFYQPAFTAIYVVIIIAYCVKEFFTSRRQGRINIPKNLIIVGTYASWYVGIVLFQGDLIFTLLNVVAHGIPYMALIWIFGAKKSPRNFSFNAKGLLIFAGAVLFLAYLEENIWDGMIWKERPEIFPLLSDFQPLDNPLVVSAVIALLVLPQITHYVLDGFIWRFSKDPNSRV